MSINEQDESLRGMSLSVISTHLFDLSKILQGALSEDIVHFNTDEVRLTLLEFAGNPLASSLFIFKFNRPETDEEQEKLEEEEEEEEEFHPWKITLTITDGQTTTPQSTIVIIKDKGPLSNVIPLENQLQVINLPTIGSSFEVLKSLVSHGVGAYFDSITSDNDTEFVNSTKKKITELALSLEHLQQTIQVPDLSTTVHPYLKEAISKGANVSNFNEFIPDSTLMDPVFLNNIQNIVNEWFKSIQSITKTQRHVSDDSALDEVNFWISMESALNSLQAQLNGTEVQLTLEILRYGKRFHATTGFLSDIGISQALELTNDYNKLMKDLPLNELVSSHSIKKVEEAIVLLVNHLKKLRLTNYPISRAVPFIEAISSDVVTVLKPMLGDLMDLEYQQFQDKVLSLENCFETWDRQLKEFTNLIRELVRKRGDKYMIIKINSKTEPIRSKIKEMIDFRSSHQNFVEAIGKNDVYLEQLDHAYYSVREINVIEEEKVWKQLKRLYEKRLESVEYGIIQDLKSSLEEALNSNEMFQIFERFQPLLERPRIRGAVHDYQSRLLSIVKAEIEELQKAFNHKQIDFKQLSIVRDYPEIACTIVWGKQMDIKLTFLLKRLELVLGSEWTSYAEGAKIHNEAMIFKKQIDVTPHFEKWLNNASSVKISGYLLKIVKDDNVVDLVLNFSDDLERFYKEVRAMSLQGFKLPTQLVLNSRQIRKIYPHGVILKESFSNLASTLTQLEALGEFNVLLLQSKKKLYSLIIQASGTSWEDILRSQDFVSSGYESSVSNHLEVVENLQSSITKITVNADTIMKIHEEVIQILEQFQTCEYSLSGFGKNIEKLQSLVSQVMSLLNGEVDDESVTYFVDKINEHLKRSLLDRFSKQDLQWDLINHEIVVSSSTIFLNPSLERSKLASIQKLQDMTQVIFAQTMIVVKSIETSSPKLLDFADVLHTIHQRYSDCLLSIEQDFQTSSTFARNWNRFQVLWDLQSDEIYKELSIGDWLGLLNKIKSLRSNFDSPLSSKEFKFTKIDFTKARDQVGTKFNQWSKDLLAYFAEFLGEEIRNSLRTVTKGRKKLESLVYTFGTVNDIISVINNVTEYSILLPELDNKITELRSCEVYLLKQRYRFPENYIHIDQLGSEYESLSQMVNRRRIAIDENIEVISKSLENECRNVEKSIKDMLESWLNGKPAPDSKDPKVALSILNEFETRCLSIETHKSIVLSALRSQFLPFSITDSLLIVLDEIKDLKSVWLSIQSLWTTLQELRSTLWDALKSRSLRKQLDDLLTSTRAMPSLVKQHRPYQEFLSTILGLVNSQKIILSLREDYIKERHIKSLFESIGAPLPASASITIGDIWDLNLHLYQHFVDEVIQRAISERSIEESLDQIQQTWSSLNFETFVFNKVSLVRNFPQLLDLSHQHVESLTAMRNSPVYKVFERDIMSWEERLTKLHQILDSWVEVQRQWMDLFGVFDSKSGMNRLLATESSRFNSISMEFTNVLKKISKSSNLVIDIQSIPDLFLVMERISESLVKISKALNDFLEKQRELFPRFYFIGNDDLLEILGNMGDIERISRHFKKMFPGVSNVKFNKSSCSIESVISQDGDNMELQKPVSLLEYSRLDEWMTQLEYQLKVSLANLLVKSLDKFANLDFIDWIKLFPVQISILTLQITWTFSTERSIIDKQYDPQMDEIQKSLDQLVQTEMVNSKKKEALIIEMIHHLEVVSGLKSANVSKLSNLLWTSQQRFYHENNSVDILKSVSVTQSCKTFIYGFEYLGSMDRLVYTPLLNSCFISMSTALDQGFGSSPFGPAGTGKTETVKALAQNLGKMSLVFNCDESFDFQAIGRLLFGICSIGGWGCFDEFNRLNSNILSAVSSQIETIEFGIRAGSRSVELLDKKSKLVNDTGIFITLNPDYTGRAALPDNLKKLFRSFSMQRPDAEVITEVLLRARGITNAKELSIKVVQFFQQLKSRVSPQQHYDFGLRSLKNTLEHAGNVRKKTPSGINDISVILKSSNEILLPRLVLEDIEIFNQIQLEVFGQVSTIEDELELQNALKSICEIQGCSSSDRWISKAIQLHKVQLSQQGVILVGSSGTGKSYLWKSLVKALSSMAEEGTEYVQHVIDPKVISKSDLFGYLDPITREWNDGLFTSIIRKLNEDIHGEKNRKTWIVFDGDIDPLWVESLNSVLDDNKSLTLPNGERLKIPENVRFIFEVDCLTYATPATISRCGMVWIESDLVSSVEVFSHELNKLKVNNTAVEDQDELKIQAKAKFAHIIGDTIMPNVLSSLIQFSMEKLSHVLELSSLSLIRSFFSHIQAIIHRKFTNDPAIYRVTDVSEDFFIKCILISITWAFAGSTRTDDRLKFFKYLSSFECFAFSMPYSNDVQQQHMNLLELDVDTKGDWIEWRNFVEEKTLESHAVSDPNTVIETVDTLIHENLIFSMLQQRKSIVLCGPPGAGKTMTLYAALNRAPDICLANMNFSKDTEIHAVLRALEQFCEYKRDTEGYVLKPKLSGKRVVLFADELNLPKTDDYGTQPVIFLLRQMIEHGGIWRPGATTTTGEKQWVKIQDIQFVGACNPAADAGRSILSQRFLNHVTVVMIDFPGKTSLLQIYKTFNKSVLMNIPQLVGFSSDLTEAMLEVYFSSSEKFSTEEHAHYVYSPRELTRWVRGLYSAIKVGKFSSLGDLLRIWAHEALRLFSDRLVSQEAKQWTWDLVMVVIQKNFPNIAESSSSLKLPILYSDWLSLSYESVDQNIMSSFIRERFNIFSDEVIDIDFILHEEAIDHILRIDRVLKQHQGHLILVGPSSSGKTTLTKFVAWISGLKIYQLSVNRKYTLHDFDLCLKDILKRTGVNNEKICFIVDESTILEGSFLERMNSLLANSQLQEIFDQDEYHILLNSCKEQVSARGLLLDSDQELYDWFTQEVSKNLHVVFTISDRSSDKYDPKPQIVTSPALFNRCVVNWMGEWSPNSTIEVTSKLLQTCPVDNADYVKPNDFTGNYIANIITYRDAIMDVLITIHSKNHNSPGKLIEFVNIFKQIFDNKESELRDYQMHINSGLVKLKETVLKVRQMNSELTKKEQVLKNKEQEAREVLDTILQEQSEAERRQEASLDIQAALEKQEEIIEEQRSRVMEDLALAEPAVLEARKGVKNIKKQHLTELRSMSSPPATVQLTLESVCVLLGYKVASWRDVQQIIRKDDFITNIVNFQCEVQVTPQVRDFMTAKYFSRPEYNFQAAFRASQACGPLLQWVEAQVKYSYVLEKIIPLKEHVQILENESIQTKARLEALDDMVTELEQSITSYKSQYSDIIREVEIIKQEMTTVQKNVSQSMELVEDLVLERTRWSKSIQEFDKQHSFIAGNSLFSAAVLTYAGCLDHKRREKFIQIVKTLLDSAGILYDVNTMVRTFLNNSANLLAWEGCGLSNDELFFENVTIIENTSKVPFIIDPFVQFVDVLKSKTKDNRVTVTSFLNDSFARTLENSLRFGGVLIIEDAEYLDPIISPILNRDVQKIGNRSLINIGGKNIDFAKDFKMYLITSDQSVKISSFVETRTTIIDFSITDSSLERQTTNITLSSERPDIEAQRIEMIKLESDYKIKLKHLEKTLLTALSESEGDLLQNEALVSTLKNLKVESKEIEQKVRETSEVMLEIEVITNRYHSFARASSILFGIANSLRTISAFYQFSLFSFTKVIQRVLGIRPESISTNDLTRVSQLVNELYKETFATYSISLNNKDKIIFALTLALTYISERDGEVFVRFVITLLTVFIDENEKMTLIREAFGLLSVELSADSIGKISSGDYSSLEVDVEEFKPLINAVISDSHDIELCIIQLTKVLDTGNGPFTSKYSLQDIVDSSEASSPIILGASPGFDPTFKVRNLAKANNVELDIVALGSKEALDIATRELERKSRSGNGWLVIQNIQISKRWLEMLEKTLSTTVINPGFKLFLTCDVNSILPITLLRSSNLLSFENAPGLKSIMIEYFTNNISLRSLTSERLHLTFLLAWLHAILQERSRLVPIGFTKNHSFNESDFFSSETYINKWFNEAIASGHISPDAIDFDTLKFFISEIAYGGKVDNENDQMIIRKLVDEIFSVKSFDLQFNFNIEALELLPEVKTWENYNMWIQSLPTLEPSTWLGLDSDAEEKVRLKENVAIIQDSLRLFER